MFDQNTIAFRLPSGLPALSVSPVGTDTFAAVDGREKAVYLFSSFGVFLEAYETVRPYRKISRSSAENSAGTYIALTHCNACESGVRRVYLLNCRFEEIGSIDLLPSSEATCADIGELMDVSPVTVGEKTELHAAFRQSVRSFDYNGRQKELILSPDEDRLHLNYAVSGTARALHFRKNGTEFVNLAELGAVYLGTVPETLLMRDLVPYGMHDIYGLFGYRYLYNYLLPIYQNCSFRMPVAGEMEQILQNIRSCS